MLQVPLPYLMTIAAAILLGFLSSTTKPFHLSIPFVYRNLLRIAQNAITVPFRFSKDMKSELWKFFSGAWN